MTIPTGAFSSPHFPPSVGISPSRVPVTPERASAQQALELRGERTRTAIMNTPLKSSTPPHTEAAVGLSKGTSKLDKIKRFIVIRYLINTCVSLYNYFTRTDSQIKTASIHLLKTNPDQNLQKAIQKAIKVAAKKLKKNESTEIEISALGAHRNIVIMKDSRGNLDILVRERLLGTGAFGAVYKAVSAITQEDVALKYTDIHSTQGGDLEIAERSNQDAAKALENELQILQELNRDGAQVGIQGVIHIAQFKKAGRVTGQQVAKGKLYLNKDFQNEVNFLRIAKVLGIPLSEGSQLKKLAESEIPGRVNAALTPLKKKVSELLQIKQKLKNKRHLIRAQIASQKGKPQTTRSQQEIQRLTSMLKKIDALLASNQKQIQAACLPYEIAIQELGDKNFQIAFKPFLLKLRNLEIEPQNIEKEIDDLMARPLMNAVKKAQGFPGVGQKKRMAFAAHLIAGMRYMHSRDVIHGDLKPNNFLWNDTQAVIGDFGGAKQRNQKFEPLSATPQYSSRHAIAAMHHYAKIKDEANWLRAGKAADIRAMGVSIYEMLTGEAIPSENSAEYYDKRTYDDMQAKMIESGLPSEIAKIVIDMCRPPLKEFSAKDAPTPYPLPVEDRDLEKVMDWFRLNGDTT